MGNNEMKENKESTKSIMSIVVEVAEWLAKVIATGLVTYLVMQIRDMAIPDIWHETMVVKLTYLFLMFILAGVVTSWISLKWSATLTLAGYLGFSIISKDFFLSPVYPYFLVFGVIMLFCYIYKMKIMHEDETEE